MVNPPLASEPCEIPPRSESQLTGTSIGVILLPCEPRWKSPGQIAHLIATDSQNLSRAALEALAVECYRTERLSESEICVLLGFETRMQVHAFLKEHDCYLHYTVADLEHDRESAQRLRARRQFIPPDQERAG